LEQAPRARAGEPTVAPQSIRDGLEATGFPTRGRMPLFSLVLLGKSKPRRAESSSRLGEIKLRLYRDFGLGVFAMSERN
jgi:hypothetical protein